MDSGKPTNRSGGEERAALVALHWGKTSLQAARESLDELRSLAETAGASVVDAIIQSRSRPDPATLIGKGKLDELRHLAGSNSIDLLIFDQELTPSQQRNIERELNLKVLDRTALILDIFAIHAHSKEGKAQVEMAQLRYALSRLAGRGSELSRLGGGIGTRGPGETKLEVDRRRINARIKTLDRELKDLYRVRRVKRKRRERLSVPTFALVGYTNAGKTSLLNALTGAGALVEDQLFSTLDPITRRIQLPGGRQAVITDTVGFINNLPHQLIEAFKSTLEEVKDADVLIHVVDAASPDLEGKITAVDEVLDELGAKDIPTIFALNKTDLLGDDDLNAVIRLVPKGILTSTVSGQGLKLLKEVMSASLSPAKLVYLLIPHQDGNLLSLAYRHGHVLSISTEPGGYKLIVSLPREAYHRFKEYALESDLSLSISKGEGEAQGP
jgi:GTP-binding protein HflX